MADPNAGVGWYEFTTPTATTGIAYVHEGGDVFVPDGGWGPAEPFHLAASRGNVHRLIRADTLDLEAMARAVADNLYGQDVHTLVMRRPGESHRDQAERLGTWAAEIVLASVLGGAQ